MMPNHPLMLRLFGLLCLFSESQITYAQFMEPPAWICLGNEIGSCYYKRAQLDDAISWSDAHEDCKDHGATLVIFPAFEEMEVIFQVITIEVGMNLHGEKANAPHYFWIGAKWDDSYASAEAEHSIYWLNANNSNEILPTKWKPIYRFPLANDTTTGTRGCTVVEIYIEERYVVKTRFLNLDNCDRSVEVKNFMCEKVDDRDKDPDRWWQQWNPWPADFCKDGDYSVRRRRLCFSHACELEGMTEQTQIRACCDSPPPRVLNGVIIKEYRNTYFGMGTTRAIHNNTVVVRCNNGFVEPIYRYDTIVSKCVLNDQDQGEWTVEVPDECVAVDCNDPPLGVHAYPPQVTGTTFGHIATYFCQPGFKEPKYKRSSVTLRCGADDTWIGLDFDKTTKAVCEPMTVSDMPWEYFDPSQPGGNDHCYKLNHTGVSWDVASDQCEQGLLYFESTDELAFLKERILDPQAERSVVWLAGRKYMNEDAFSWRLENSTNRTIQGYQNWAGSGPLTQVYHRDLCVAANYSDGMWKWVNVTCDNKFEFICKTMLQKIHGMWTEWTEWTACDREYIRRRSRTCNGPAPFCGGDECVGDNNEASHCCIDPGQAPYARLAHRGVSNSTIFLLPGNFYTYECWHGYEHETGEVVKNITCQLNGTWTEPGEAPACIPKLCDDPVNGSHSTVSTQLTKFDHGAKISYNCERGFVTRKEEISLVQLEVTEPNNCTDGNWLKPPLTCYARLCKEAHPQLPSGSWVLRNINSTYIRHTNNISHMSWGGNSSGYDLFEDSYQYFCQFGFRTIYKSVDYNLTCGENGLWSKMASFANDSHPITCEPVRCPVPPPLAKPNSIWTGGSNPNDGGLIGKYQDEAHYECIAGYRVDTGIADDDRVLLVYTFTCGANNAWTDTFSPQKCIKQTCGDPGNGTDVQSRIGKSFLYQGKLDYVCKQGYVYNNSITRRRIVCDMYNGSKYTTWNGTELNCSKVDCGDPGKGSNVTKKGDSYQYADIVIYQCAKQHVLTGGGLEVLWLRCGSGGSWNGTAPSCEPAEISSDFEVIFLKPFAVQAQWIMSEKYKGVPIKFYVIVVGRPGYQSQTGEYVYLDDYPDSALINETKLYQSPSGGLLKMKIFTLPDYVYEFKLESQSLISLEEWPSDRDPIYVYTSGGVPFLGAVQEENLPNIIPLTVLPKARVKPIVHLLESPDSVTVTFDKSMFSEQNGTITGFSVIVKEVHPFHSSEATLFSEGYHDRYPNELFTYRELEVYTKYSTWPPYFAVPLCNLFEANQTCQDKVGGRPSSEVQFLPENMTEETAPVWLESIYINFPTVEVNVDQRVWFNVGTDATCSQQNKTSVCNGPLRKNRKFCVKLRAYNRYGWNDSLCSDIIPLTKVLEFDKALLTPTILASLPFVVFCGIGICMKVKDSGKDELDDAEHDEVEGDLIKAWSANLVRSRTLNQSKRSKLTRGASGNMKNVDSDMQQERPEGVTKAPQQQSGLVLLNAPAARRRTKSTAGALAARILNDIRMEMRIHPAKFVTALFRGEVARSETQRIETSIATIPVVRRGSNSVISCSKLF